MRTCINFGDDCKGCSYEYCIDGRRCFGRCYNCLDCECDNHPNKSAEMLCYADELT